MSIAGIGVGKHGKNCETSEIGQYNETSKPNEISDPGETIESDETC